MTNHKFFLPILLLAFLLSCTKHQEPSISILEIIDKESVINIQTLDSACMEAGVDLKLIFTANHHWAIYTTQQNADKLKNILALTMPTLRFKHYETPFYDFNRQKYCNEQPAGKWSHYIMTANLKEDTTLQNEYMEYHRTQREEWPEVSKGFCNAGFEQVLVFRNGRQLMLVISIPEGADLDELNTKTTYNNPRVNDWNALMSQYQEGIEDAPEGVTWLNLEPYDHR